MKNNRYIATMVGMLLMMGASTTAYGQIVKGKVFGGGQLAQVIGSKAPEADTTCIVTIHSGSVYGSVYGAGEGVKIDDPQVTSGHADVAKVTGKVKVNLTNGKGPASENNGGTAWRDIFGGGALAKVDGDTYINMYGGHIAANVYGGGEGDIKKEDDGTFSYVNNALVITSADVTGNTNVSISGGDIIWDRTSMTQSITSSTITYIFTGDIEVTDPDNPEAEPTIQSVEYTYSEAEYNALSEEFKQYLNENFTRTEDVEETSLVEGEIVYWDTTNRTQDFVDESHSNHKIHNELFYDEANNKFRIKHNIFGGGYVASRVGTYNNDDGTLVANTGTASVSMVSGLFGDDLIATEQWKLAYNDNQDPHFYVFGGGFGAYTSVGHTQVKVGVTGELHGSSADWDQQWAKPGHLNFGDASGIRRAKASRFNAGMNTNGVGGTDDDPTIGIADDSYGEPLYTILGILGGGYAGIVTGNTDVRVGGNTFMHRIYGGGYGQLKAYNELLNEDKLFTHNATALNSLNRENLGIVMGNTYVETQGGFIHGDVFGGGAGVESAWQDGNEYKELDENHTAGKDFTMGVVNGITEVKIGGDTEVYGNVYGGGDVACVLGNGVGTTKKNDGVTTSTTTTDVAVVGGLVTGNVFGGGSGRRAAFVTSGSIVDHTVQVGAVTGNTIVTIDKVQLTTEADVTAYNTANHLTGGDAKTIGYIVSEPEIYGNIYGGGAYGQVKKTANDSGDGNTVVTVNAGYIGDNIFGGGLGDEPDVSNNDNFVTSANIAGNTTVNINGGSALWSAISDENGNTKTWNIKNNMLQSDQDRTAVRLALVTGDTQIFKTLLKDVDEAFFDVDKLEFKKNHNIYGGGDRVCQVAGDATVTVNHALVTDVTILDPNNEAGLAWAASIDNKEHPQFSVFGGGYGPHTSVANTTVKYQCGNTIATYAAQTADHTTWATYFGGLATAWADPAKVSDADKNTLYGGNNQAGIWRYAVSQLAWSSGIPNLIMRGVFGGGYAGLVAGNTNVTVSDKSCMRYVYGGGLGSKDYLAKYNTNIGTVGEPNYLYRHLGEVGGNSTVTISGGVVSKEVYGGGAGIEPKKLNGEEGDYTDLVDMARVKGKTSVSISGSPSVTASGASGTVIIGDVFGGGDVANVGMEDAAITGTSPNDAGFVTSQVNITSGCMLGQVFAGGNGRTKDLCSAADANGVFGYQKVGAIFGNTLLSVDGYDATSSVGPDTDTGDKGVTYIFKRMFGGGNNGSIRKTTGTGGAEYSGHTYVTVNGGYFAYNVFGGGVGSIGDVEANNTYSYVEGDTHVKMLGGLAIVDQYWDKPQSIEVAPGKTIEVGLRQWAPLNEFEGKKYSAQYDPVQKKLLINHNVYAGCRNAGYVNGNTYLTMNKGYIRSGLRAGAYDGVPENFFDSKEWEEIYNKIGSPHFCIFGGGFGENTHIKGDTYVDINIDAVHAGLIDPVTLSSHIMDKPVAAKRFEGGQSMMDIIGGGYSGDVAGATHVKVSGDVFARRVFGGSFYAPVSQTNILINSIYCDDIFGGGMMGDVTVGDITYYDSEEHKGDPNYISQTETAYFTTTRPTTLTSGFGNVNLVIGKTNSEDNKKIFISNNVFGGNDVSGVVRGKISNSILGGTIYNNVYGAGNGNYLYAINQNVNKVTTHENYEANSQIYPLVYEVPKREEMDFSMQSATDAQKIVNINTYRPNAQKVLLNIGGSAADNMLTIKGNVFGGGNTATVNNLDGDARHTSVVMNIGSHCNIGGVYMGNDGDAMFQEANGFMDAFQKINGVDLAKSIQWHDNPMDRAIAELYLPVKLNDRPTIYPHVLDLYFQPVEMSLQPTLNWCSGITLVSPATLEVTPTTATQDTPLANTTIGVFVAGGNRGNMNVTPAADGRIVNYEFPEGLTITNRIVGGCNNANYTLGKTTHVGGYLLGKRNTTKPAIDLSVKCMFGLAEGVELLNNNAIPTDENGKPVEQRNVYGGCYSSGTINGDINIDFRSSMLTAANTDNDAKNIAKTYFGSEVAMGNVYGAGYGSESYVYGNTKVTVNPTTVNKAASAKQLPVNDGNSNHSQLAKALAESAGPVDNDAYAAMSVYGGGQQGNVIGNTTVRILNGHIGKSVVGGSYAGYMWGSTQVLVGYPTYYTATKGGMYKMMRTDKWNTAQTNHDDSKVVKQEIYVLPGDIISQEVYEAIADYDSHNSTNQHSLFAKHTETPTAALGFTNGWNDIKITIDEACYGGGYSLASGSSVAAGTYTVKKYDETMNITKDYSLDDMKNFVNNTGNTSTKGYGGNTTVLVWDNNDPDQTKDHINISTQTMKEVELPDNTDLFGYYHKKTDGSYGYIYQEGEYFYHKSATGAQYYQQAFESDSEGGMYGDGHLSFAEGFRSGELVGYGFSGTEPNGAKVINTFQRMDMLRLKDCSVAVLGARDYTVNEISKTPYSLARIGELQMVAENVKNAAGGIFMTAGGNLAATTVARSRNYLGLSNNIHYLGAVKSNVDFNSTYHYGEKDASKARGYIGEKSYRATKQEYVTKSIDDPAEFQKRNDGTAANMIGISSGYAMKVQNVFTEGPTAESFFYGPIVGVVEMNLIDVREDEGGGYVYADNVHHRSTTAIDYTKGNYDQVPDPDETHANEDFLETSGNFVFPYDKVKNRYIVDDCFPTGYPKDATQATAEAHYWYVTGYNYYYNAHITGYTYNSAGDNPLYFNSDKDALLTLTGAKAGQTINLQSLKWRSNHIVDKDGDGFVACDLETPKVKDEVEQTTGKGNTASSTTDDHYVYDNYNLFISAPGAAEGSSDKLKTDDENAPDSKAGAYTSTNAHWANLPLTTNLGGGVVREFTNTLTVSDPTVTFQLKDNVDNSGIDYYTKYMQQPCQATVVLTCPATEADGTTPIMGYVPISYFFTTPNGDSKMTDGTALTATDTYYYFGNGNDYHPILRSQLFYYNKEQQRYVSVNGDDAVTTGPENQRHDAGPAIDDSKLISGSQDLTFYAYDARVFTYTIYLTIDYVQGPDVSGNLKIYNCALPGEKIKIDKGTIDIKSDVSMSQTAAIWRFTKDGKVYDFDQANPYDEEATTNKTDEMLKDVKYSEADNCIYVPAYYFMNGYKVAYWYRVNGIDQDFPAPSSENDYLTIHNYHRMLPRAANGKDMASVDFKLDEAQKRINEELEKVTAGTMQAADVLPEPRIYIADDADLNELPRFLGAKAPLYYETYTAYNIAKGTSLTEDEFEALPSTKKIKEYGEVGSKYDFGKHMQFHLLNDITLKTTQEDIYNAPDNFKGTLNGNGYVLSGLGVRVGDHTPSGYLFTANEGNIYNLGLKNGVITKDDEGTTNAKYHNSYTWSNKTVYRMNGTAVGTTSDGTSNTYTENDWRYGKVTYDLNQYYLEARKAVLDGNDTTVPEASASGYVASLFHNGDYLYARWQTASPEYLRTTASQYDANYNSATSYHIFHLNPETCKITHDIDESRAVYDETIFSHYAPLYEAAKQNTTSEAPVTIKNDYLFFGQKLDSKTKSSKTGEINVTIPEHIDADRTHDVTLMNNRVYRAGGYYKSNVAYMKNGNAADRYDTNAGAFFYNRAAYAHDNGITAIDFYGYQEPEGLDYEKVVDYPTARLASMDRADGVTRNLLVYANNEDDVTEGALKPYVYNESTPESNIKMHIIKPVVSPANPTTAYFHLVERTSADKDAEGNTCLNNDFDAPIAFDVTKRAWYTRQPAYYAERNNDAWEGITLPFTANKVKASLNGEITHFYGTPSEAQKTAPNTNDKTLHHEYWLRGLTGVDDKDASKTKATFQRPGEESGLFGSNISSGSSYSSLPSLDYTYNNPWFVTTYGENNYNYNDPSEQNKWYSESHTYSNYKPLTAEIPYIVSFPGNRFYEFDLSSEFYNDVMGEHKDPQTVTFENKVPSEGTPITIAATSRMETKDSSLKYAHVGTFLALTDEQYAMNDKGTEFVTNSGATTVLPFRTYMELIRSILIGSGSGGQQNAKPNTILIGSHGDEMMDDQKGVEEVDPSDGNRNPKMIIYPRGRRVIVESPESTTLNMYTIGGQLIRVLDVREGTNSYSGFGPGIYIVGQKRLMLK